MVEMKRDSGTLTVVLPKRIDTNNADGIHREIMECDAFPASERIIFDAMALEYISSAGLRMILSIRKMKNDLKIINVNDACWQIFEVTGFAQILDIERVLRFVSLDGLEVLGRGRNGSTYRLNPEMVLKVYNSVKSQGEANRILLNVRQAFVRGLPTMIPFEVVETPDGLGTVFEMFEAECFSTFITSHPEKTEDAAKTIGNLALKLSSTDLTGSGVMSRRDLLLWSIQEVEGLISEEDISTLRYYVESAPNRCTAVHGDLHARNIMMGNGEYLLIDMDDFSYGHPVWDLAAIDRVYNLLVKLDTQLMYETYPIPEGLTVDAWVTKVVQVPLYQREALWKGITDCYFEKLSTDDREKCLALIDFYTLFLILMEVVEMCRDVRNDPEALADRKQVFEKLLNLLREQDFESLKGAFDLWNV